MKLSVFTRAIPAHGGGGMERVSWDLMTEWVAAGVEVTCYTTPFDAKPETPDGLHIVQLPGTPGKYSRQWWGQTAERASQIEDGLLLGVGMGAHSAVATARRPVVMQSHGTSLDELRTKLRVRDARALAGVPVQAFRLLRDLERYKRYSCVVAVGPSVAHSVKSWPARAQPRRLEMIENGVRQRPLDTMPQREGVRARFGLNDQFVALCIGRLHKEKGFDLVMRSMSQWDGHLLIVGSGPAHQRLRQRAHAWGLSSRVTFAGRLSAPDAAAAYSAADCMVALPRRIEGLPMVLLESLSYGLPIVTTADNADSLGGGSHDGIVVVDEPSVREISKAIGIVKKRKGRGPQPLPAHLLLEKAANRYLELFVDIEANSDVRTP